VDLCEAASELKNYAQHDGTELGEYCLGLVQVTDRREYASEAFLAALHEEIKDRLLYFQFALPDSLWSVSAKSATPVIFLQCFLVSGAVPEFAAFAVLRFPAHAYSSHSSCTPYRATPSPRTRNCSSPSARCLVVPSRLRSAHTVGLPTVP